MIDLPSVAPSTPEITPADRDHLNLLGIFYYVWGGLMVAGIFCGFIGGGAVIAILSAAPPPPPDQPSPAELALFMGAAMCCSMILTVPISLLNIMAGIRLRRGSGRTFCFVVAAINCLSIPIGITLAIFTFIVLARPQVAAWFDSNDRRR
jgi:hypothetical protein